MNVAGTIIFGLLIVVALGIEYRLLEKRQRRATHKEALAALGRIWGRNRG